jgi:lysine-specific demethylase 8
LAGGRFRLDRSQGFEIRELALRDYVERIRAGEGEYYLRAALVGKLAPLARDLETPSYFARRRGVRKNLWFASAGTVTPLHFDLPNNLYVHLWGRKRFILFPPAETGRLYAFGWTTSTPHLSRVDPERSDDERFPRFREARGSEALLEPGDALFIPARFWHHARALSDAIAVNFWSPTSLTRPLLAVSDLYKRLRGLNI